MASAPQRRRLRVLVIDESGARVATDGAGALPFFDVELEPGETSLLAAARVLPGVGLAGPVIECLIDHTADVEAVPVLVHVEAPDGWRPPHEWRWAQMDGAPPAVEPGLSPHLGVLLDERHGRRPVDALRPEWSRHGWYERACEWIEHALAAADRAAPTAVHQVRHWGISAVMRVETADGRCWFKAVFPPFAREPAVSRLLDREAPGRVAPVVDVSISEGWLLLDDVGDDLSDDHADRAAAAVEQLVWLQRRFVDRHAALAAAGCRHRSLQRLPGELAEVLASPVVRPWIDVDGDEAARLVAWVERAADRVAALGLPDTLVHGDFHPGNVAVAGGDPVLIDWSDAAIAHPLVDAATWAGWLEGDDDGLRALWQAFADAWSDVVPADDVLEALPMLLGIAGAYHTISYAEIVQHLEPVRHPENGDGLTQFYGLLTRAAESP